MAVSTRPTAAVDCKYCNRTTRNPDGWCRVCLGEGAQPVHSAPKPVSLSAPKPLGSRTKKFTPRPHQTEDTELLVEELFGNGADRAQARAACGMGKTITAQMTVREMSDRCMEEKGHGGRFLVMCPTIDLALQLRNDYETDGVLDGMEALSIHDRSEQFKGMTAAQKAEAEKRELDKFFTEDNRDGPKVVFVVSSVTSSNKISDAQERTGSRLEGAIFDEAHNYGGELGLTDAKGKKSDFPKIFFDDEEGGIQVDKRVFMTATPRTPPYMSPYNHTSSEAAARNPEEEVRTAYLRNVSGESNRSVHLDQGNATFFGNMVSSRSYAEAVEGGFLNPVDAHMEQVMVKGIPQGVSVSRTDRVSLDGSYVGPDNRGSYKSGRKAGIGKKRDDGNISLGAYQSACSLLMSLARDEEGSSNTISFSDSIDEALELADRNKWRGVARSLSMEVGGLSRAMSDRSARKALTDPKASENRKIAARLHLLGENAQLMSVSSKDPEAHQSKAMDFLDKKRPGEDVPEEKWVAGWNPAPKVLCNVDKFSEGVNLPSVDRVVMNRPSKAGDSAIYQVMGRASRKWNDENGNPLKGRGKFIIPETATIDNGEERQLMERESCSTLRAVGDIFYDSGAENWRDPSASQTASDNSRLRAVRYDGGTPRYTDGRKYARDRIGRLAPDIFGNSQLIAQYKQLEMDAQQVYKDSRAKGSPTWMKLSQAERDRYIQGSAMRMGQQAFIRAQSGQAETDKEAMARMSLQRIIEDGITKNDVDDMKAGIDNVYRRRHQGEELTTTEKEFLAMREISTPTHRRGTKDKKFLRDMQGRIMRNLMIVPQRSA